MDGRSAGPGGVRESVLLRLRPVRGPRGWEVATRGRDISSRACAAVLLAACGAQAPRAAAPSVPTRFARGLVVTVPAGWQAAPGDLTPHLVDPRQVVAVATYPLRYRPTPCAQVAGSALADLRATDALVILAERGRRPGAAWAGFPSRPPHFGPGLGGPSEAGACVPSARFEEHGFAFTDGGRHFHVMVAFGPAASAGTRGQAWAVLDGLRVDPSVRPDWRASP